MKQEHWVSGRGCVYNINYHKVWSTKYRRKVLDGVRDRLIELHREIAEEKGVILQGQEVMSDHVHLIITAHPKYSPAQIVKIFKGITAKTLFDENPQLRGQMHGHLWDPSYYCGTMSDVTKVVIERYVEMQKTKGL